MYRADCPFSPLLHHPHRKNKLRLTTQFWQKPEYERAGVISPLPFKSTISGLKFLFEHDNVTQGFALFYGLNGLIDLIQRIMFGYQLIQLEFSALV